MNILICKMKTPSILAMACLAASGTVLARMGDSEAECRARYGEPIERQEQVDGDAFKLTFEVNRQKVLAGFINDKVRYMEFTSQALTEAEIENILEENSQGNEWSKRVPEGMEHRTDLPATWMRPRDVIAWYHDSRLRISGPFWVSSEAEFKKVELQKTEPEPPLRDPQLISGKWKAMKDGVTHLIDFGEHNEMTMMWIERGLVSTVRGKYAMDYTATPISIDLYELDTDAYDGRLIYGIAEFQPDGRLLFDLHMREPGEDPVRPTAYSGNSLSLSHASEADFSLELAEAEEERLSKPEPPEIRGQKLPNYSDFTAYPSGNPKTVWLGEDAEIQGVYCWHGNEVNFFENGQLESADLAKEQDVLGVKCAVGSNIRFYESGQIQDARLAVDQVITGMEFMADTDIGFYENGQVKYGSSARDQEAHGLVLKKGQEVDFPEEGQRPSQ